MEALVRLGGRRGLAGVAIAFLLTAGTSGAQTGEYTIGVGDEIEVTVWQRPDLGGEFTVDSEGNITLPLIGAIRASGMTVGRLGDGLTRRFSFVDRDVSQVTVAVSTYYSRRIFIMGQVVNPGPYAFATIPGVWEVLREAGGPTADAALNRVRIIPPAGTGVPVVVDLERVLATGDFSTLPVLRSGSTILVPRLEAAGPEGDVVYVYGAVQRPGIFSIDEARTLLMAILAAGGPRRDAKMGEVRIVRPGPVQARVFEVSLLDYVEDGRLFSNVTLLPGDTVTVPRNQGFLPGVLGGAARFSSRILGNLLFFL